MLFCFLFSNSSKLKENILINKKMKNYREKQEFWKNSKKKNDDLNKKWPTC